MEDEIEIAGDCMFIKNGKPHLASLDKSAPLILTPFPNGCP